MAFNINEFQGHLKDQNEFAYANKFDIYIGTPPGLRSIGYGEGLTLSCENVEMPGVEINQIEFQQYSFTQRIPHRLSFSPIPMTFYCTGKMMEKTFFDTWANLLVPFKSGLLQYTQDNVLTADIAINQYNNSGELIYSVELIEAYPISVSSLMLSWSDDGVNRLQVLFAYKKWLSVGTTQSKMTDGATSQDSIPAQESDVNNVFNIKR